jgi:hypothetical protein
MIGNPAIFFLVRGCFLVHEVLSAGKNEDVDRILPERKTGKSISGAANG